MKTTINLHIDGDVKIKAKGYEEMHYGEEDAPSTARTLFATIRVGGTSSYVELFFNELADVERLADACHKARYILIGDDPQRDEGGS